jgi:hypothetical protein
MITHRRDGLTWDWGWPHSPSSVRVHPAQRGLKELFSRISPTHSFNHLEMVQRWPILGELSLPGFAAWSHIIVWGKATLENLCPYKFFGWPDLLAAATLLTTSSATVSPTMAIEHFVTRGQKFTHVLLNCVFSREVWFQTLHLQIPWMYTAWCAFMG